MPINDPPFSPTHGPNYEDYGKLYVPSELANTMTPYTSGGVISASTTFNVDAKEIERLKKELAEEHEKRLQAEMREAVLKVRLENSQDNKADDEDEIDRLEQQIILHKKIQRDVMFILAESASSPASMQGHSISSYRILVQQITTALKQEPRKV